MNPTLPDGTKVGIRTLNKDEILNRQDIVVFSKTPQVEISFQVKRVIALPGETVIFRKGGVWIKDTTGKEFELDESKYINPTNYTFKLKLSNYPYDPTDGIHYPADDFVEKTLEKDEYFLLGDNRSNSVDSRSFGPILRKDIKYIVEL